MVEEGIATRGQRRKRTSPGEKTNRMASFVLRMLGVVTMGTPEDENGS
jgi:hypothetical protein